MSYAIGLLFTFSVGFLAGFLWYGFESEEAGFRHCVAAGVMCGAVVAVTIFALDTWFPVAPL